MKAVGFLVLVFACGTALGKSVQKDPIPPDQSTDTFRERKQFLSWLFGDNPLPTLPNYRTDVSTNLTGEDGEKYPTSDDPQQKPNVTVYTIGPFVFTDNNNPNLNLTTVIKKEHFEEIGKNDQVRSRRALPAVKPRRRLKRKSDSHSHVISKRQSYFGGMTPQQQMLILQQQALLQRQQQLYGSSNNIHQNYGGRKRRRPQYEDFDDDDDDSDEYDVDFDSDEFSSNPFSSGGFPSAVGGFSGFPGR